VTADGGDVALAAKALAQFRRETDLLAFKGGVMGGEVLTADQIMALSRLPAREVLHGQLVGVIASPITGLVRGLNALIAGLAIQLQQIAEQGLVGGGAEEAPAAETPAEEPPAEAEQAAQEGEAAEEAAQSAEGEETESSSEESAPTADEAVADEPAPEETDAPSEGDADENKEG
jgi:large subunit ribosomal protein L10